MRARIDFERIFARIHFLFIQEEGLVMAYNASVAARLRIVGTDRGPVTEKNILGG